MPRSYIAINVVFGVGVDAPANCGNNTPANAPGIIKVRNITSCEVIYQATDLAGSNAAKINRSKYTIKGLIKFETVIQPPSLKNSRTVLNRRGANPTMMSDWTCRQAQIWAASAKIRPNTMATIIASSVGKYSTASAGAA